MVAKVDLQREPITQKVESFARPRNGALGWLRTSIFPLTRWALYQLSYTGIWWKRGALPPGPRSIFRPAFIAIAPKSSRSMPIVTSSVNALRILFWCTGDATFASQRKTGLAA